MILFPSSLPDGELQVVSLETIDERLSRYRLRVAADESAMLQSLKRFGQISPVVVTVHEERTVLIDGFKRLRAPPSSVVGHGSCTACGRCGLGRWNWTSVGPRRPCSC
jgi:hypothetical protein